MGVETTWTCDVGGETATAAGTLSLSVLPLPDGWAQLSATQIACPTHAAPIAAAQAALEQAVTGVLRQVAPPQS